MKPRALAVFVLATVALATTVAGQSSQFGIRGLGIPMRPYSPRATATGGAFGLFDLESSVNPAAIAPALQFTSLLTTNQSFRSSTNPFGSASGRDARFPQIIAAGPIGGTPLAAAISVSGYTDRSFSLGTEDTLLLRGVPVAVFDTMSSSGGLTDLRVAVAWRASRTFHVGLAGHAIPGNNRIENRRAFADSSYASAVERNELSYLGFGVSGGLTWQVDPRLTVAGVVRTDGHARVERDTARIATTDLPLSLAAGILWQPSLRFSAALAYQRRGWSAADADIRAQGGIGAEDAQEISLGIELVRDARNPAHRPLRFGVHYATLPFPLQAGRQAREIGLAAGTGFRFTGGRGGVDLALQQLFRSDGEGFTERATVITLGVSIRP
jgi:hypothetical protein